MKNFGLFLLTLLIAFSMVFISCDSSGDDGEENNTGDDPVADLVIPLGDDQSGQGNATAVDNEDGTWTLTFSQQYGWYQRSVTNAPQDLSAYNTITIVISNDFASGTNGVKLDIQDGTYASIFTDSNENWTNLANGASSQAISWDLAGEDLSSVTNIVIQNNTDPFEIILHSITFSAE